MLQQYLSKISGGFSGPGPSQIWTYTPKHCSEPIQTAIKKHRLRWLGHVLRMSPNRILRVALKWTPQRKRKQDRPKANWRQSRKRLRQ